MDTLYTLGFSRDGVLIYAVDQAALVLPTLPYAYDVERDLMLVDTPRPRDEIRCNGPILPWGADRPYAFAVRRPVAALDPYRRTGGRTPTLFMGKRVNVYLDEPTLVRARQLGGGELSEGIRRAVRIAVLQDARTAWRAEERRKWEKRLPAIGEL